MATYINHDIRSVDGKYIQMPPWVSGESGWGNLALPDVYFVDQTQKYPLGTRYHNGDRTWVYTKLGALSPGRDSYKRWLHYCLIGVNTINSATIVTATEGENTARTTMASVTADLYAGGYICFYSATERTSMFQVLEHTLTTAAPVGDVTFTFDGTLPSTYSASDTCNVMKPLYAELILTGASGGRGSSVSFEPFLGVLIAGEDADGTEAAEGDFTWAQTWGPCFSTVSSAYAGSVAQERNAYFMSDGAHQVGDAAGSYDRYWCQQAGFLLPCTCETPGTSTSGSVCDHTNELIFLKITR